MKFTLSSRLWFFLPMPEMTAARPRGSADTASGWEFIRALADRGGSFQRSGRVVHVVGLTEEKRVDRASATGECPGL